MKKLNFILNASELEDRGAMNIRYLKTLSSLARIATEARKRVSFPIQLYDNRFPTVDITCTPTNATLSVITSDSSLELSNIPHFIYTNETRITALSFSSVLLNDDTSAIIWGLQHLRTACFRDVHIVMNNHFAIVPLVWSGVWRAAIQNWTELVELHVENCGYAKRTVVPASQEGTESSQVMHTMYQRVPEAEIDPEVIRHDALELNILSVLAMERKISIEL
jgi:hypothetical protein